MMRVRSYILIAVTLLMAGGTSGNAYAQTFGDYNLNDDLFRTNVKLIDEFIERFNNDSTSEINRVPATDKAGERISRKMMLVSLLNLQDSTLSTRPDDIKGFILSVDNRQHPAFIEFTDSDWYAEAKAVFSENGRNVVIPLILHIVSAEDWSKWMIAGIGKPTASPYPAPQIALKKFKGTPQAFISSSAHVTGFSELHNLFTEKMKPEDYFEPAVLGNPRARQMVDRILKGTLRFLYVPDITYYFYNVEGWQFTVNKYTRKTFNSGWLISDIKPMNNQQKITARNWLLNR